jgi:predicted TIM-barrel fold metal-dependent hydrolase
LEETVTITSEATRAGAESGRAYLLISGDSHVNEPGNLWVDHMPAKFGDRIPHVVRTEQGDGWVFDGVEGLLPFGLNCCAGQDPRLRQAWVTYDEVRPGGWDPAARIKEIDKAGVDAEVLYPTPRFSHALFAQADPELHLAMVQAYNDWLAEYAEYDLNRFRALPILPNRGQDMAVAEIERIGGRTSTGGFCMGAFPGGTLVPAPEDDKVFAALAERGLSVNIHVSLAVNMPATINTNVLPAGTGSARFVGASDPLTHMIFSGLFDRVPELNAVFAEVDCGWVPYYKEQIDDGFLRYRFRYDLPRLPSEYVERHAHFTYVTDRYGIDNRYRIGVERIIWSSDYPHGNSNYPDAWPAVLASLNGVPADERHLICAGNAMRLYGFGR